MIYLSARLETVPLALPVSFGERRIISVLLVFHQVSVLVFNLSILGFVAELAMGWVLFVLGYDRVPWDQLVGQGFAFLREISHQRAVEFHCIL